MVHRYMRDGKVCGGSQITKWKSGHAIKIIRKKQQTNRQINTRLECGYIVLLSIVGMKILGCRFHR